MKVLSLSSLKACSLPIKYGSFSQYAQRFLKFETQSFSYNFSKFFNILNSANFTKIEKLLCEEGIKQVGKNETEGLIVQDKALNCFVCSPKPKVLQFKLFDISNNIIHSITFNSNCDRYEYAGDSSVRDIEDFISKMMSTVDAKMLAVKKKLMPNVPQPYLPDELTSQKISELNKVVSASHNKESILSECEQELLKLIKVQRT